jgi:peptidyl-prolyl cis-trans isomerase D
MITWIQIRIQKHLKILFIALLVVMVVTFVLTIGNQSFFGSHDNGHFKTKDFYGYNLASENAKDFLQHSGQISAMLSQEIVATMPRNFTMEEYSNARAVGIAYAQKLGIRTPDGEALKAYVRTKPVFFDESGKFSAKRYEAIINSLETRQRISEATIVRILGEDYQISKIRELIGGAGFVLPDIVAVQRQSADTEWTFSVARLSIADFKPEVTPSDADLQKFYNDNKARFEIPDKIKLMQVRFPAVSFVASVQMPTNDEIEAFFNRNKTYYTPAAPGPDGKAKEAVLDAVTRARVVQDLIQQNAIQKASGKASDYTVALWGAETTYDNSKVVELAKTAGAQITSLEPFAQGNPPRNQDITASQLNEMWTLATSERFFSDVIPSEGGASVFIYQGTIPSRMPSFAEVKNDVESTYIADKRESLFATHGNELQKKLTESVASGKGFSSTAKDLGMSVEDINAVKFSTASPSLLDQGGPMEVTMRQKVGGVSSFQIGEKGGFIVYLQNKKIPPADTVRAKPEEVAQIRNGFSNADGWIILGELSDKRLAELEKENHDKSDK